LGEINFSQDYFLIVLLIEAYAEFGKKINMYTKVFLYS